ncbi:hypothetical protein INT44_005767, partial [Umbelopsis vinacea]
MPPNSIILTQNNSINSISTYATDISKVDPRDRDTPDHVVARNTNLIRLTGKHPFNAEPSVHLLDKSGFITPNDLHFVRNHGAVAHCDFDSHQLQIHGEVKNPCLISMSDLLQLPSVTFPVTMTCAGNRRKEVNMRKQTIGFNWGAAGVSTARWTGVPLKDVINTFAGGLTRKARHVCFEGCDNTPKGPYGTSITTQRAMNEVYDVILAYKMNGEWLSPDHGFPLRVIVPGCIGGRSVKWLTKIHISETESSNIYHYVDNKVFPSFVDKALADAEKWWYRPDYTLYDLNVNSAILCPDHGATLPVSQAITDDKFDLRGYAYSGGNRKITRVELSFDGGETWELTTLTHPEEDEAPELTEKYDHGYQRIRHWCWGLWSYSIKPSRLLRCQEICVRAWDEAQNTQPGNFSWNLMGMMNNSWFTIKVDIIDTPNGSSLRFRHPTIAGPEKGGWLDDLQPEKQTVAKDTKPLVDLKTYSWREVEKHNVADDCWIVVRDMIYDCTPFMKAHPGGIESILLVGGQDCTEDFDAIHSTAAHEMLQKYIIGTLSKDTEAPVVDQTHSDTVLDQFLDPKVWKSLVLEKKVYMTPDICLFRFAFSSPAMKHGLPVGKHVYLRCQLDSKFIMRAYTPSVCGDDFLEFIIKIYRPAQDHPLGGLFTQQLEKLSIGNSIETKGPLGSFEYFGMGQFIHLKRQDTGHVKDIGMICAGTGITPIWQVLMAISQELGDQSTRISLIYGNRYEEDIILRQELEDMAQKLGPERMSI